MGASSWLFGLSWLFGVGLVTGAPASEGAPVALDDPAWVVDAEARRGEFIRLPSKSERALEDGARSLLAHQDEDGRWSSRSFTERCEDEVPCQGTGSPEHDVGVTGLAALAVMAAADMTDAGDARAAVERALAWLVAQQDAASGLIGEQVGHAYLYSHAIAATALAECRILLGDAELDEPLARAVICIAAARNPESVWRYELPPTGDNDTSITAWMIGALATARQAGAAVEGEAFTRAVAWVDEATDRATGRVGYNSTGSASSRVPGVNDRYPTDCTEAMTGAGMLMRLLCGQDPSDEDFIGRHADLILKRPPAWDDGGLTADVYAWYHATAALHQLGGSHWRAWSKELVAALTSTQLRRGEEKGSWPPVGPWGWSGGRVYTTAMAMLTLAAPVRHAQMFDD